MEGKEEGGLDNPTFVGDKENEVKERKESTISIETDEKDVERTNWDNPIEFLLSCISMSVGLGNIWRFPATAFNNGGGAFVIPYLIVLLFIGRPIYFLELLLGQFASYGSVKVWSISPFFKGLGFMGLFAGCCLVSYYCSIIATSVFYFIVSFQSTLPWDRCGEDWENCTDCATSNCPQMYFEKDVMRKLDNINDGLGGAPAWDLSLCLLFVWAFIFLSLIRGVQSSGKVAYFTAIFPYFVLITFLIRGVTLEGAWKGIEYFITPQWEKIYEPKVWYEAVAQCFFSLGTGTGALTMFASYNPFRHPCYRDALVVSLMDTATSLLAGFTVFAVLGHLAFLQDIEIKDMAIIGPGLAFISYPAAIAQFDWVPQLFAVLFFLMLFTLGIGSAIPLVSIPITAIEDAFPNVKKIWVTLVATSAGFLIGLIYMTPGGQFLVDLVDYYGAGFLIYLICLMQSAAIAWFYGLDQIVQDIHFMTGIRIGLYWKVCWGFVIPVGLTAILIYKFATEEALKSSGVEFPLSATISGWMLVAIALSMLLVFAILAVRKSKGNSLKERVNNAIKPSEKWGPRSAADRKGWKLFQKQTEFSCKIRDGDKVMATVKVRGMKSDVQVVQEGKQILITLSSVAKHSSLQNTNGPTNWIQGLKLGMRNEMLQQWTVSESKTDTFSVKVLAKNGFIHNVDCDSSRKEEKLVTFKISF